VVSVRFGSSSTSVGACFQVGNGEGRLTASSVPLPATFGIWREGSVAGPADACIFRAQHSWIADRFCPVSLIGP
jgi:hypothetical protein